MVQPEAESMYQAWCMTALLPYLMEKDEREIKEREKKGRDHLNSRLDG